MLIVTNFERFPEQWVAADGSSGRAVFARDADAFLQHRSDPEAVFLVNCSRRLVLELARRQTLSLGPRRPIVSVDIVLRAPRSFGDWLRVIVIRSLLKRVDQFILYFRDIAGLSRLYGLPPDRTGFTDFKANVWNLRTDGARPDGEYAICFGRSLRDYDTFFEAVEQAGIPGAIVDPNASLAMQHGSRFTRPLDKLPPNVTIIPDDMSNDSQARVLERARLVVVPIVKGSLVASGISTILNAMALGKCVIASSGPGVTDLFDREVLSVPPEDVAALAATLKRAWSDTELRTRTAQAGWEYAMRCGSEQDMIQRIIDIVAPRQASARR